MNKLILILSFVLLTSCYVSKTPEYKQSLCSVDKKGFKYKSGNEHGNTHNIKISGSSVYFTSSEFSNFINIIERTIVFSYSGTKENGIFSYQDKTMKDSQELGVIHYYCWKALKNKYTSKMSFKETINN